MRPPGILRRRAPFLAPLWMAGLAAIAGVAVIYLLGKATIALAGETTTVIVLRHAEKAAEPLGDPVLSPQGIARAARLADLLGATPLAAIYSSDTQRTRQTAAPLAVRQRLPVTVREGKDIAGLLEDIGSRHIGRSVVVVGHSNTVPGIVSTLTRGRRTVTVGDDEYGRVFIVTVTRFGPPAVTEVRY